MSSLDRIGFIGPGRVAQTIAPLLSARGAAVATISGRNHAQAEALASKIDGCRAHVALQDGIDGCDLVFLTVSDDAIRSVCASLRWRPGQAVVHCSGATELAELAPAARAGAHVGAFHPLQIFSDPDVAQRNLAGSYVAIEAEPPLADRLTTTAGLLGLKVLNLPAGGRAAYHLGANLAASCLLAVLEEAKSAWVAAGLPAETALPALLPLIGGTLDTARRVGLSQAVSGPVARGDSAVLRKHIGAARMLPGGERLYGELLDRLLDLRRQTRQLDPGQEEMLDRVIAGAKFPTLS